MKKLNSQNIYIKLKNEIITEEKKTILFLSHIDSKGETISIAFRMFVTWLYLISFTISLIINVFKAFFLNFFIFNLYIIEMIVLSFNFIALILFLLNKKNNKSLGSLDNASGIACVLELLSYFSKNPLENTELLFAFTGAEECGTQGIRYFYKKIQNFDRNKIIFINFETIGKRIYVYSKGLFKQEYKAYFEYFNNNVDSLNLELKTFFASIGHKSDGHFLLKKNLSGMVFCDLKSFKYAHSLKDTIDKVDPSILRKICCLLITFLNKRDKERRE